LRRTIGFDFKGVTTMNQAEKRAVLTLALLAAYADGANAESENAALKQVAETIGGSDPELASVYQRVLFEKPTVATVAAEIAAPELRRQAYEMAVGVCDADGAHGPAEAAFLRELAAALGVEPVAAAAYATEAAAIAASPMPGSGSASTAITAVPAADVDPMIVNCAVLNGALELLPQSLASMAIIPLQMRMVYRIGRTYGFELDRGHVTDLLATVGVGLASQYLERFGRRLVGGLLGSIGGGILSSVGSAGTGAAMSFATTYALGQVAKRYYSGGRQLDAAALRETFTSMLGEARTLQSKYAGAIERQAKSIDVTKLAALVRGN
jgi:uncharacterized protein (DUF697 family)/tellurite resistance protein